MHSGGLRPRYLLSPFRGWDSARTPCPNVGKPQTQVLGCPRRVPLGTTAVEQPLPAESVTNPPQGTPAILGCPYIRRVLY